MTPPVVIFLFVSYQKVVYNNVSKNTIEFFNDFFIKLQMWNLL